MAPEVGLEPTTLGLTAEGLAAEYVSFQWSIEEQRGQFGVLSARNWTRFWTKFFKQPGSRYLIVEEPKRGIRIRRTDEQVRKHPCPCRPITLRAPDILLPETERRKLLRLKFLQVLQDAGNAL